MLGVQVSGAQAPFVRSAPPGSRAGLTCGLTDPVGVDEPSPRLSWNARLPGEAAVVVSCDGHEVWRSAVPAGSHTVDVPGEWLAPLTPYTWSVEGHATGAFTTGLRARGAWDAPWLAGDPRAAVSLRGSFTWRPAPGRGPGG
ncbi:hypothetical protein [Streptosporangium saharense]|uniref:hypothetical protein n=1 Tax=Streptosporangium saharense TaxID=1706840 RepID=UPI0033332B92